MIRNWSDFFDTLFGEGEDGSLGINRDLRPEMTEKFLREYNRQARRALQAIMSGGPQPHITMATRKYRARRRRK